MFEIVPYADRYRPDVARLLGLFWRLDDEFANAFFQWKYIDCPYSNTVNISVLKNNDAVVGMRGAYVQILTHRSSESTTKVALLGDTLIEKPHRGQGQFNPLSDALLDLLRANGISIALNMSASKPVWESSIKHGWQSTDYFSTWRHIDPKKQNHPGGYMTSDQALGYIQPTTYGNLIYSDEIFSAQMAELCDRQANQDKLEFLRDETWFNWRYRNPMNTYRFIYLFEGDSKALNTGAQQSISTTRLKGFLVVGARAGGGSNLAYLADWGYDEPAVFEELVTVLLEVNPYYQLDCICEPDSEVAGLLDRLAPPNDQQSELLWERALKRILVQPLDDDGQDFFDRARLKSGLDTVHPKAWRHAPIHLDNG